MLSLCEMDNKIKNLEGIVDRKCDLVYIYDKDYDRYLTIDDIRIDSENDIVMDCGED